MRVKDRKVTPVAGSTTADLINLLQLSKLRLSRQMNYFSVGDLVLVLGVPFHGRNLKEPCVYGYEMHVNKGANCDFELYFKDLLFNSYCKLLAGN